MENTLLYRIIDFETFVDLMLHGEERYVNPQKWEDTYEGYIFRMIDTEEGRKTLIAKLYELYDQDELKTIIAFERFYTTYNGCYAQCWTATEESDALWRIYSYGKHSIRIGTTTDKVKKALSENGHPKGKIIKIDYGLEKSDDVNEKLIEEIKNNNSTFLGYKHKREAFRHENEYRAMFMEDIPTAIVGTLIIDRYCFEYKQDARSVEEIVDRTKDIFPFKKNSWKQTGIINVDIKDYIDSILVNPFAEDWYVERVRKICRMKGIEEKFLGQSILYKEPFE